MAFSGYSDLLERAHESLPQGNTQKLEAVSEARRQVLDAARSIRDCVAHQSEYAFRRMNECLLALPAEPHTDPFRRRVNSVANVGAYLKAKPAGSARTVLFLGEFRALAEQLQ